MGFPLGMGKTGNIPVPLHICHGSGGRSSLVSGRKEGEAQSEKDSTWNQEFLLSVRTM